MPLTKEAMKTIQNKSQHVWDTSSYRSGEVFAGFGENEIELGSHRLIIDLQNLGIRENSVVHPEIVEMTGLTLASHRHARRVIQTVDDEPVVGNDIPNPLAAGV